EEEWCHNRSVMERLVDTVLCLTKGGRPFRGHHEKADHFEEGLFLNLVNMLQKYDPVMAKHVQQSPQNSTYLSNRIQNDLIVALHNIVQQKIVSSLNGKMVSIIADDTTDCGHYEQMSIVKEHFMHHTEEIPAGKQPPPEAVIIHYLHQPIPRGWSTWQAREGRHMKSGGSKNLY
ncbi:hypothetical protein KIL84_003018, partial [Mauremys mutica]